MSYLNVIKQQQTEISQLREQVALLTSTPLLREIDSRIASSLEPQMLLYTQQVAPLMAENQRLKEVIADLTARLTASQADSLREAHFGGPGSDREPPRQYAACPGGSHGTLLDNLFAELQEERRMRKAAQGQLAQQERYGTYMENAFRNVVQAQSAAPVFSE
ncbi:hypothetical protein SS50377_26479 [Spironucleus salmonicida]|uniref:Uncharacterized protein n=1 Tax=Spironucleus salmonicida TaxID=348837 RepID=V6LA80_9EUKA|nr:hypothetical protein SS50377_26472 [Spironucleus salmonicida]KAH0572269.1 hypothetical protein SS50377_26479 [Spironucleus salmonicida]|eukprot:EST41330.1 Hypothetical protein SS50377_19043 [Spironucleus salmonicida]